MKAQEVREALDGLKAWRAREYCRISEKARQERERLNEDYLKQRDGFMQLCEHEEQTDLFGANYCLVCGKTW